MAVWSGDTVVRDGEGLLRFVGRDDAMIKSAGNRISPSEIEEAAVTVSGIAEACALGRPDERLGQAIILFVRADAALCENDAAIMLDRLRAALRQSLPNFMQPAEIHVLDDLPRNPNGKIDRVALAKLAMEAAA
jgi:acyl-coenzyme A synthetase/AMP-(fatty) acid ligase